MKYLLPLATLVLFGLSACAHNPRPESPEQRAERQAQSLQEQQDARAEPRSAGYTTETENESNPQAQNEPESQSQPEQPARSAVRRQAASVRGTVGTMTMPVYRGVGGVTGGILR